MKKNIRLKKDFPGRRSARGLILLLLAFFILPILVAGQNKLKDEKTVRKRALLIGISNYKRNGNSDEWWNLNTELDVQLLNKVLVERFRFLPEDIVVLQNERATKANILAEWRKIVDATSKGDVVFVHFSGHGASIKDDNGDELDGFDESLVPFDYVSKKDYSKNIRDDEIGKFLDELKKKEPGNVTITLDSCYSGTATRGDFVVRGGSNDNPSKSDIESPSGLINDKNNSYPKDYVFLSAASPRQLAKETDYEGQGKMGAFSFALVKALSETTPRTTYRDLYERINDIVTNIRRNQNPQLEGSLDETVFDGTAIRQERFVSVKPAAADVKFDDQAILQIGSLQGATVNSRYALYAAGTKDPTDKDAVKIAEGKITATDALTSVIKFDKRIEAEKLRTARAFETQHYYADIRLKVVLQNLDEAKGGEKILTEFIKENSRGGDDSGDENGFDLAQFSKASAKDDLRDNFYDIKIYPAGEKEFEDKTVSGGFSGFIMERKDGSILAKIPDTNNSVSEIKAGLVRENRFRLIKSLKDNEDPRLRISLKVVVADVTFDASGKYVTSGVPKGDVPRNSGGQPELKLGEYIMLEIENTGELDVYFTILNLQVDGKIAPSFPGKRRGVPPLDNFIKKGQKILLPHPFIFKITGQTGEESFRAIATVAQTDFTPLIDEDFLTRGETRSEKGDTAAKSPLGKILIAAQNGKLTRTESSVPPAWATSSFTYLVKAQ